MADIITAVTSIVTFSVSALTSIVTYVVSAPLLLFFCLISFVGVGIGLLFRFVRR